VRACGLADRDASYEDIVATDIDWS
jgi:hypothetical protein